MVSKQRERHARSSATPEEVRTLGKKVEKEWRMKQRFRAEREENKYKVPLKEKPAPSRVPPTATVTVVAEDGTKTRMPLHATRSEFYADELEGKSIK